ncbi:hypothetical protein ACJ5NV_03885 [Loktanella agnita]|uniref:hypothetical protein n=1 Tax=Loktanella agnita TaxID=287097 RepID=UPI0039886B08
MFFASALAGGEGSDCYRTSIGPHRAGLQVFVRKDVEAGGLRRGVTPGPTRRTARADQKSDAGISIGLPSDRGWIGIGAANSADCQPWGRAGGDVPVEVFLCGWVMNGPNLPLASAINAAMQLPRSGHSLVAQRVSPAEVCCAGQTELSPHLRQGPLQLKSSIGQAHSTGE